MAGADLNILIVEDNPGDIVLIKNLLSDIGEKRFNLLIAHRISDALKMQKITRSDLILLDLGLPDESGLNTLRTLLTEIPDLPVVVLSGLHDEGLAMEALSIGAQDFLVKGSINGLLLTRSIFYAIKRKELEDQLTHIALHDALTGLPNRQNFFMQLGRSIENAKKSDTLLGLLLFDMNDFKAVNDSMGHQSGDELLVQVAKRLREAVPANNLLARLGGDEFAAILGGVKTRDDLKEEIRKIIRLLSGPYPIEQYLIDLPMSLGVSVYPEDGDTPQILLKKADRAMDLAKKDLQEQVVYYTQEMEHEERSRKLFRETIHRAILKDEVELFYQPKVNLRTGHVYGAEALVRWRSPDKGLLLPGEFLPWIQGTEVLNILGDWTIRKALWQMDQWRQQGLHLPVSVNIDVGHLKKASFFRELKESLDSCPHVPTGFLEIEILETTAMEEFLQIQGVLRKIHALGVRLSLDDFGTGYSSLSYLKNLPVDTLKIDQSFVIGLTKSLEDLAIVRSITSLARIFNRNIVAEGMEDWTLAPVLLELGCEQAQGYGIAKPMPAADLPRWIESWTQSHRDTE